MANGEGQYVALYELPGGNRQIYGPFKTLQEAEQYGHAHPPSAGGHVYAEKIHPPQ